MKASGIYLNVSPEFQGGGLDGLSRTIRASGETGAIIEFGNLYESGVKGYNRMNGVVCDPAGVSQGVRANSGGHNEVKVVKCLTPSVSKERGEKRYRVRKLTARECFRLMDFADEDFDKAKAAGVSDSQLYRQSGNSICVGVLEAIFRNMMEG